MRGRGRKGEREGLPFYPYLRPPLEHPDYGPVCFDTSSLDKVKTNSGHANHGAVACKGKEGGGRGTGAEGLGGGKGEGQRMEGGAGRSAHLSLIMTHPPLKILVTPLYNILTRRLSIK